MLAEFLKWLNGDHIFLLSFHYDMSLSLEIYMQPSQEKKNQ